MEYDFTTLAGIMAAAEELKEAAKKVDLEYWFDIDFHFMSVSTNITKGIGPGSREIWPGCVMAKLSAGMIGQKMADAAEALAKYQEDRTGILEKEVAELAEKLKAAKTELRRLKKGGRV